MAKKDTVLVLGAAGQIGTDLVMRLRSEMNPSQVIATDVKELKGELRESGPGFVVDVLDFNAVAKLMKQHEVTEVYLLAALLSATAEQNPKLAWKLNMEGLFNVLDIARENSALKIFWPSSIAVFGPTTPRFNTPQHTIMEPSTVYGVSKQAGERWCEYYNHKFNVDVRSLRYPGLISYKSMPGGGTTDYAVDIYHKALEGGSYECFLRKDSALPMMYMPDALDATIDLMRTPYDAVKIRSSYNVSGMSFSPEEIAAEIRKHIPEFTITYKPDFRQAIADSWPASIDDKEAREQWGWKEKFDLASMTSDMLMQLKSQKLNSTIK
ncbi:MAG: NAD-dependent epimerase/dehydratase family protein [Bacteroidota bacterium]|nr:NAD-dependent epimerase/dehydratase family protein [Bacteroidota bacterium]